MLPGEVPICRIRLPGWLVRSRRAHRQLGGQAGCGLQGCLSRHPCLIRMRAVVLDEADLLLDAAGMLHDEIA